MLAISRRGYQAVHKVRPKLLADHWYLLSGIAIYYHIPVNPSEIATYAYKYYVNNVYRNHSRVGYLKRLRYVIELVFGKC